MGLGRMGLPVRERLGASGSDPLQPVDPAFALDSLDVLVTVLPGRKELAEAAEGEDGFLAKLRPGALWLDLTSGDPVLAAELATVAAARNIAVVGAPMGGGPKDAVDGTLTFYVGGEDEAVTRALPILNLLGSTIERAGSGVGDGHTVKLLANLLWFGQAVAVTEAMLLGERLGVETAVLRDILPRSAGGSTFMTGYLDRLIAGDYVESFGIDRVVEELDTLVSLADDGTFELSTLVARLHRETLERFGPVDGELLVAKLLQERADGPFGHSS
jgi:3-hydroxyisobutyrate dehydrogenase